jgi:hypothetical protein
MKHTKVKIDRQAVYDKYDGHCAYCGEKIPYKAMQVDHIRSKHAYHFGRKTDIPEYHMDDIRNLNPSCRMCNYYKHSFGIESFRKEIKSIRERFMKIFIVKLAVKYGIIAVRDWSGEFYFERKHKRLKRTK